MVQWKRCKPQSGAPATSPENMNKFDKTYIKKLIKKLYEHAVETRKFLSNPSRVERERAVVRAFLRTQGISFDDKELNGVCDEPVDVEFRTARFQNRELLEHQWGSEWKKKEFEYSSIDNISDNTVKQLLTPYSSPTQISLAQLVPKVSDALSKKAAEYPAKYPPNGCRDIDALVYVNLKDKYLTIDFQSVDVQALKAQGWRSVSILFPPYGLVLISETEAPDFLKPIVGQPQKAWVNPATLFE